MSDGPVSSLPPLDAHLGYWLRLASNHVSAAFAQALQARQISVAEWVALRYLYDRSGIAPGELTELLGMTRGAVSKVLDKLEAKGWIVCTTRPEDRRGQALSLTSEGRQLLPELVQIADANDAHYFDCLESTEQVQLRKLLQKLAHVHHWTDTPID